MKVLVDSCIWFLAFRRTAERRNAFVLELEELIREFKVQMIGPIRQEVLSGIRSNTQFQVLRERLRAFPDLELTSQDYERAAELFNIARGKGIQGSNTDFLICALSERYDMPVLTVGRDFQLFRKHLPIKLHTPRPRP
jgi:predicted nucleic acid-binding protein